MTGGEPMETLIELTETELDAVVGGQTFATSTLKATSVGGNPIIISRVNNSITPNTAFLETSVEQMS
jgi:hypothetical protein